MRQPKNDVSNALKKSKQVGKQESKQANGYLGLICSSRCGFSRRRRTTMMTATILPKPLATCDTLLAAMSEALVRAVSAAVAFAVVGAAEIVLWLL